jgi:hypothetical protein
MVVVRSAIQQALKVVCVDFNTLLVQEAVNVVTEQTFIPTFYLLVEVSQVKLTSLPLLFMLC